MTTDTTTLPKAIKNLSTIQLYSYYDEIQSDRYGFLEKHSNKTYWELALACVLTTLREKQGFVDMRLPLEMADSPKALEAAKKAICESKLEIKTDDVVRADDFIEWYESEFGNISKQLADYRKSYVSIDIDSEKTAKSSDRVKAHELHAEIMPMTEADYRYWVDGTGKSSANHAFFIHGMTPPDNLPDEKVLQLLHTKEPTKLLPLPVVKTFQSLEKEVRKSEDGRKKYDYRVYNNDVITGVVAYFTPEVLEEVCKALGITLSDHYWHYKEEHKEHTQKLFDDPIYRINFHEMDIEGTVSTSILNKPYWSVVQARYMILGRKETLQQNWNWFIENKAKYEGAAESKWGIPFAYDLIDALYMEIEAAGRRKNFTILNPEETNPAHWQIDPESFLLWGRDRGIHLRPELKERLKESQIANIPPCKTSLKTRTAGNAPIDDSEIIEEMRRLIVNDYCTSANQAAEMLSLYAQGGGTPDSKTRRIGGKFRSQYGQDVPTIKRTAFSDPGFIKDYLILKNFGEQNSN